MRIASFRDGTGASWGVVMDERVSDARGLAGSPADVRALLEDADPQQWLAALAAAGAPGWRDLDSVVLLPPVRPSQDVIALGLNYIQHVDETTATTRQFTPPKHPILFGKAATSVTGPYDDIRVDRSLTTQVDWEVELALVIGRPGRDIPTSRALDHVFGYTVGNDVSARDLQFLDGAQWYRGKSLDTFCPLGPWIVTRDEIGDGRGLHIELRVNGMVKQSGSTDELIFDIPAIIASASAGRTLLPGDVILTGTPGGVGFSRTPPEFLADGDEVEAEIERIGVVRNSVRFVLPASSR